MKKFLLALMDNLLFGLRCLGILIWRIAYFFLFCHWFSSLCPGLFGTCSCGSGLSARRIPGYAPQ